MFPDSYDFKKVEAKWQNYWQENRLFQAEETPGKKKFYCLVMFPYPSGRIHMGHVRNYTIGDVIARYQRMQGYNVLHPIGWDAFGLPAENAAIKHKISPEYWTRENIAYMRQQLQGLGLSYDWRREIATCTPEYYRWNQVFFIRLLEKDLAYRKKSQVNWCPSCSTVLANEQVTAGGLCWRCDTPVGRSELEQWFLRITTYVEELLADLESLRGGWPEEVLTMQSNWIGKSYGAEVDFPLVGAPDKSIRVYTTRPDTLFGATFMALAPEHPLIEEWIQQGGDIAGELAEFRERVFLRRLPTAEGQQGIFSRHYARNPVNQQEIPIWVADYVLPEYGWGAIMAVPAHDQRDFAFAQRYNLPVQPVIKPPAENADSLRLGAYEGEGVMENSGEFSGLTSSAGRKEIVAWLEGRGLGKSQINYRLKDWLISRQRYWGTPIPVVYCSQCGVVPMREKDLPVLLPAEVDLPGRGESPLARLETFTKTACPQCGGNARRETDTMDTFVDSSWYYARYCDADNSEKPFAAEKVNYWLPVNQYIGGIEHACMHLIYARFFHKVLRDLGYPLPGEEPFTKLLTQGMVTLGGKAMSKSHGNVVEPDEITSRYGVDTARLFILFAAPPEKPLEWSASGVEGAWRFLNRVWRLVESYCQLGPEPVFPEVGIDTTGEEKKPIDLQRRLNRTVKKVTDDIEENFQFNTAIAAIMELVNFLQQQTDDVRRLPHFREALEKLLIILAPFAPHLAEELWERLGNTPSLVNITWPVSDPVYLQETEIDLPVQINGRLRATLRVGTGVSQKEVESLVKENSRLRDYLSDGEIKKVIYVPGKIINLVIK